MVDAYIKDVLEDENIPWNDLRNCAILVTGATGLVGGNLIRVLSAAGDKYNLNVRLIGHGRNSAKGKVLADKYGITFVAGDIRKPVPNDALPPRIDYIIHCAAVTGSAHMLNKPSEVAATMIDGTRNTLDIARDRRCKCYLYLSSMEVYGQPSKKDLREGDLGLLDPSNPRSSYPESKRRCENMSLAYATQYSITVKIARLSRTFGFGFPNEPIDPDDEGDMRVAAQFARKAVAGKDIELHTKGKSIANCCHTLDTISGLLTILLKGKSGETYNIAGAGASATIREMADIAAAVACENGKKIKVIEKIPEDIQERGYNADIGYTINADKLRALGWMPKYNLEDMFRHMITGC